MLKIKDLRIINNLSQKELADKLQLSNKSICAYENGYAVPKIDTIIKMSRLFGCSIEYLLGLEIDDNKLEYSTFIKNYNKLNNDNKKLINEFIDITLKNQK